jgi:hypothetical protein
MHASDDYYAVINSLYNDDSERLSVDSLNYIVKHEKVGWDKGMNVSYVQVKMISPQMLLLNKSKDKIRNNIKHVKNKDKHNSKNKTKDKNKNKELQ